ncbi:MAG: hypothetical protein RMK80_05145 [Pseudobdellovibrionaceae bacterium]|nr:hypothetical protein [Pseudobdellovibrionaceae bacterium]
MKLVTGFEPFLNYSLNPSWELAQELSLTIPHTVSLQLPVAYSHAFFKLRDFIKQQNTFPESVYLLGLSAQRFNMSLEVLALNWMESINPDNWQQKYAGQVIEEAAPPFYLQENHPAAAIVRSLGSSPFKISYFAGTYVCNEVYFRMLHYFFNHRDKIIFIHVPPFEVLSKESQIELLKKVIF